MAVTLKKLTALQVKEASGKGRLADGGGLWLQVAKGGGKSWLFIYRWHGKRPEMGLGSYPSVSLADARRMAESARTGLAEKPQRDPRDVLKTPDAEQDGQTFGSFTEAFLETILSDFKNAKHRQQWKNTLTTYAAPIWNTDIADIDTADVLSVLQPIWSEKRETARRVRGRIERILDAAKAKGLRTGENPARWRGHLSAVLPDQRREKAHHPAMPFDDVPGFVSRLNEREALSALALQFIILTAARSSEAREATWDEIDLDARLWTVPANRMKVPKPHRVPLSDAAMAILEPLAAARRGAYVFPGQSAKRPLSETSIRNLLGRMGVEGVTIHGFRSSFRDWAGERTRVPREVAEQCLAHRVGDETERAYRRGDALEKRRTLMQAWADHCCGEVSGNVVALHG